MVEPVQPTRLNMNVLFTAVILSTIAAATALHAQEESWVGTMDEEDLHAVSADLDGLRMDLNRVGAEDLQALPWISTDDAHRIVAYRAQSRPFRRVDDLVGVRGISWETVEAVRPYLYVSAMQRASACSSWRLTRPSGGKASWTDLRLNHRTDLQIAGLLEGYLLTERDPGESELADHWSGYLLTTAVPGFERVLVGDFRPGVGQGLLLSRQTRTPMGLAWARPGSSSRIANRSAAEDGSLRGLFAEVRTGPLVWTAIHSGTAWDAVADTAGYACLRLGGEHVSQAQRERKDALKERLTALRITGQTASARLGILMMRTVYAAPLSAKDRPLSTLSQIGLDGSMRLRLLTLFGEFAGGVGHAWLAGASARFGTLRVRALARRYSPGFLALRGSAFSAYSGRPGNEWGQFVGAAWTPWRATRFHVEIDRHGRIVPKPPMSEPARGLRSSASITQRAGPLALRISLSSRERTVTRSGATGPQWRRSVRTALSTRGESRIRGWYEEARGGSPSGSGAGRAAGLGIHLRGPVGVDFSLLGAAFRVDTYDARLYVSEPDVWGGNRLVVLSGQGQVAGLRIGWRSRWCRATGRYSIKRREAETASSWALQIGWGRTD